MMHFLRKHQKKLFIAIAVATFASFAFLGGSSGFSVPVVDDTKIGQTLNGKPIYERDIKALTHFLSMGSTEILRADFIETGVFSCLAEKYFAQIQSDFQDKLHRARTATFYSHPQAPFINAIQVWNRFSPQLVHDLKEVQAGAPTPKTFSVYSKLFLDQQLFSPELLRTILMYEQQNYAWITADPSLRDIRQLSLFGYQTFEDWFGSRFSGILGSFILNTACIAEKKGYKVSTTEARTDFIKMCSDLTKKDMAAQTTNDFMRSTFQAIGIDESRAVELWRKVMLVHRFFQDMQQGVLLDPIPYQQFSTFADAKASVMVYQLPEALRVKDFRSMLKVQYYLEAVSPKGKQSIVDLPRQFYSAEEVEKKHPQLVISRYELEVAKVTQDNLAARHSLRQLWNFEISDRGWDMLIVQFPVLNRARSKSAEEREKILDTCEADLRKKIDRLALQTLYDDHPEWLQAALQQRPSEKVVVELRSHGAVAPFEDIEETFQLQQALQTTDIGDTLLFASPGNLTHYQIKVLQKPAKKEVMTLEKALELDWLGTLLDEKLEAALESARADARKKENSIYKGADGSWRPFSEVKDHVGAYVYGDLLSALSRTELSFDEYAAKRFEAFMEHAKTSIQKENESSKFLVASGQALVDQWCLSRRQQDIKRCDTTTLPKSEMFTKTVGSWSSVVAPRGGDVAFFYLLQRETGDLKIQDQVNEGQKLIGQDAARQRMQVLIEEVGPL